MQCYELEHKASGSRALTPGQTTASIVFTCITDAGVSQATRTPSYLIVIRECIYVYARQMSTLLRCPRYEGGSLHGKHTGQPSHHLSSLRPVLAFVSPTLLNQLPEWKRHELACIEAHWSRRALLFPNRRTRCFVEGGVAPRAFAGVHLERADLSIGIKYFTRALTSIQAIAKENMSLARVGRLDESMMRNSGAVQPSFPCRVEW